MHCVYMCVVCVLQSTHSVKGLCTGHSAGSTCCSFLCVVSMCICSLGYVTVYSIIILLLLLHGVYTTLLWCVLYRKERGSVTW